MPKFFLTLLFFCTPLFAVDFVHDVAPIFAKHCAECHTNGKHKGGFSMNHREELLTPTEDGVVIELGNAKKSLMHELITSDDEDIRMPPKGKRLTEDEVKKIADWINAGAKWEPGFTFAKKIYEAPLALTHPKIPAAISNRNHPIDRIIDAFLAKQKFSTPQKIDDATFARRVNLDIVGLLPSPENLQKFLADHSSNKREKLIDDLLAEKENYTAHWLTFWNDLLRNDYAGTGFIEGGRKQISNWLYQAIYQNTPYNEFASALIAPSKESEGFALGIKWRGDVSAGQTVPIQYAQSIGQTFLGINLKCASCHDSFIDRWKLTDAYGLAAAFSDDKIEIARCDKPTGKIAQPYWLFPELGKIDADKPREERLKQIAALTTTEKNGRFARTIVNRLWHRLMGRGIVHPVDAMNTPPWNADLLDYLANYLVENHYDVKKVIAHITQSQAYQSRSENLTTGDETKWHYAGHRAKRMTAEQFVDALWTLTATAPSKPDFSPPIEKSNTFMIRASLMKSDLLMRSLGRPNREQIVTSRPNELTTLEAMDLNNGGILSSYLERGAKYLLEKNHNDARTLTENIFIAALSRKPTDSELRIVLSSLGETPQPNAVQDLLWSIIVLPEFQLVR